MPDSIFDMSRMPLTTSRRCSPDSWMSRAYSRWRSVSGGAEELVSENFGEADDGVQRRPQLVAHMSEEVALGEIGAFGGFPCLAEFEFLRFAAGDVAGDRDHRPRRSAFVHRRAAAHLDVDEAVLARIVGVACGASGTRPSTGLPELKASDSAFRKVGRSAMCTRPSRPPPRMSLAGAPVRLRAAGDANSTSPLAGVPGDHVGGVVGEQPVALFAAGARRRRCRGQCLRGGWRGHRHR